MFDKGGGELLRFRDFPLHRRACFGFVSGGNHRHSQRFDLLTERTAAPSVDCRPPRSAVPGARNRDNGGGSGMALTPTFVVNQNVLPSPGRLCTPTAPPMSSASRWEMLSPSPLPPCLRVVDASTWLKF